MRLKRERKSPPFSEQVFCKAVCWFALAVFTVKFNCVLLVSSLLRSCLTSKFHHVSSHTLFIQIVSMWRIQMVLGELHRGKFTHRKPPPLVKLPRRKSVLVKLSCGKFHRGTFPQGRLSCIY